MVNDLAINDLYEIKKLSPLSDFDRKVVLDLYMPLIGAKAVALYFTFFEEKSGMISNHEKLLRNTGFSVGEMVGALNALEAVSLVATYLGASDSFRLFSYCLYAPHSPRTFFGDPLFAGTLTKYIGEADAKKLAKRYSFDEKPKDFKNVSMDFVRYFSPDLNDGKYVQSILSSGGKKTGNAKLNFDFNGFIKTLQAIDNRYNSWTFSQQEVNYIERVQGLYGYSVDTLADFVNSSFDGTADFGNRLNRDSLLSLCKENARFDYLKIASSEEKKTKVPVHGDSGLARMTRNMQRMSPMEFLSSFQKGNKPAPSDISLIQELTLDMGLNNEVTNALLFYVLSLKNNTLPKAYTEKIAASLVREGLETAIDTMNYFTKTRKQKDQSPRIIPLQEEKKQITNDTDNSNNEPKEDISFDEIFAGIKKGKI